MSAQFDDVVRPEYQDLLWEGLGRPARLSVPLGHYTSALAMGPILTAVTGFFDQRAQMLTADRLAGRIPDHRRPNQRPALHRSWLAGRESPSATHE